MMSKKTYVVYYQDYDELDIKGIFHDEEVCQKYCDLYNYTFKEVEEIEFDVKSLSGYEEVSTRFDDNLDTAYESITRKEILKGDPILEKPPVLTVYEFDSLINFVRRKGTDGLKQIVQGVLDVNKTTIPKARKDGLEAYLSKVEGYKKAAMTATIPYYKIEFAKLTV